MTKKWKKFIVPNCQASFDHCIKGTPRYISNRSTHLESVLFGQCRQQSVVVTQYFSIKRVIKQLSSHRSITKVLSKYNFNMFNSTTTTLILVTDRKESRPNRNGHRIGAARVITILISDSV